MNITPYKDRLQIAVKLKDKKEIEQICFDLEFTQLEYEKWLPEVFDFYLSALHNFDLCSVDGCAALITSLYNDFEKLDEIHKQDLISAFDANSEIYGDEMLIHSISDLLARKFSSKLSLRIFKKWRAENNVKKQYMARVGIEILLMARRLDSKSQEIARSLLINS